MDKFLLKEISSDCIEKELLNIGFDEGYRFKAADKFRYKNIKIFGLTVAQANILKQTALIFGSDCAVNRNVVTGAAENSDVILCGSYSQLKKIAVKLKAQPFSLASLAESLEKMLSKTSRRTKLAGVLNVTPDSFSDGGMFYSPDAAQKQLLKLIEDGAELIDIGAESTKPYSMPVESDEQIRRLRPVFDFVNKEKLAIPISVDTRDAVVADFALNNGAQIINDVSGFEWDKKMPSVIAKYNAGVIIQHSQGTPENMQNSPVYNNVVEEIYLFLRDKAEYAKSLGIKEVIIDPGIGFGKQKEDNFIILDRIQEFYSIGCPIMAGVSRKSFLGVETSDNDLKDSLTLAVSYPLMRKGVDYLRVHNVSLHKKMLDVINNYTRLGNSY